MSDNQRIALRLTDPKLIDKLDRHMSSTKQTVSGYIRDLIIADLDSIDVKPDVDNENCLVELTRTFNPAYAKKMQAFCESGEKPIDQPIALARMLKSIATGNSGWPVDYLLAAEDAEEYNKPKQT